MVIPILAHRPMMCDIIALPLPFDKHQALHLPTHQAVSALAHRLTTCLAARLRRLPSSVCSDHTANLPDNADLCPRLIIALLLPFPTHQALHLPTHQAVSVLAHRLATRLAARLRRLPSSACSAHTANLTDNAAVCPRPVTLPAIVRMHRTPSAYICHVSQVCQTCAYIHLAAAALSFRLIQTKACHSDKALLKLAGARDTRIKSFAIVLHLQCSSYQIDHAALAACRCCLLPTLSEHLCIRRLSAAHVCHRLQALRLNVICRVEAIQAHILAARERIRWFHVSSLCATLCWRDNRDHSWTTTLALDAFSIVTYRSNHKSLRLFAQLMVEVVAHLKNDRVNTIPDHLILILDEVSDKNRRPCR
jgi:hypothetical protein